MLKRHLQLESKNTECIHNGFFQYVWHHLSIIWFNNNLLLTEREGRTGEYWPEVVTVRTERSEVRTKTTEGQYSPVRLEQAWLVSSLLYGIISLAERTLPVVSFKSTSGVMSEMWGIFPAFDDASITETKRTIYNTSSKTFVWFILYLKGQASDDLRKGKNHKIGNQRSLKM